MKTYMDVKKRITAFVLAMTMVLSSISVMDVKAAEERVEAVSHGDSVAQIFTAEGNGTGWRKIDSVTMDIKKVGTQDISFEAYIHRGLAPADGGNYYPYSASDIVTKLNTTTSIVEGKNTVEFTPASPVCLAVGEKYSVVVMMKSYPATDPIRFYVTDGGQAFVKSTGRTAWDAAGYNLNLVVNTSNITSDDVVSEVRMSVSPSVTYVDINDPKDVELETTLTPALPRKVSVTETKDEKNNIRIVSDKIQLENTLNVGEAQVSASVVGGINSPQTATIKFVEASLVDEHGSAQSEIEYGDEMPRFAMSGESASKFDISYSNNTTVGSATAIISEKNGTYQRQLPFTIKPVKLTATDVNNGEYSINSAGEVTSAKITKGGKVLTAKDFNVSAKKLPSDVVGGSLHYNYEVTVTSGANTTMDESSLVTTVSVEADTEEGVDIRKVLEITMADKTYSYDGSAIVPEYTARLDGTEISQTALESICNIEIFNNTDVPANGEAATIVFTGKSPRYSGEITEDFMIVPASITTSAFTVEVKNDSTTGARNYIHTGSEIKPEVTVKKSGNRLTAGTDYTIEYSNNIEIGQMTIKIKGKGNYRGSKTINDCYIVADLKKDVAWSIKGKSANSEGLTGYTVTYKKSAYSITVDDIGARIDSTLDSLDPGIDFKIEKIENNTNAGKAKVTIKGCDGTAGTNTEYKGQSMILYFTINPTILSGTMNLTRDQWTYSAESDDISIDDLGCSIDGIVNANDEDYTLGFAKEYANTKDVGTYEVVATGKGNYTGTISKTFKIVPKSLMDCTIDVGSVTYNGFKVSPTIEIKDGEVVLAELTDYKLDISNNLLAGKGKVKIQGINNYTGTVEKEFDIRAKDNTDIEWSIDNGAFGRDKSYTVEYTGKDIYPSIILKDSENDKVLVLDQDYTIRPINNKLPNENEDLGDRSAMRVTLQGNYSGTFDIPFTITKRDIHKIKVSIIPSEDNELRGGIWVPKTLTVTDNNLWPDAKVIPAEDYEVVAAEGEGDAYDLTKAGDGKIAVVKIKNADSYYVGEETFTYEIGEKLSSDRYFIGFKNEGQAEPILPKFEKTYITYTGKAPKALLYKFSDGYPSGDFEHVEQVLPVDADSFVFKSSLSDTPGEMIDVVGDGNTENIVTVSYGNNAYHYGDISSSYILERAELIEPENRDESTVLVALDAGYTYNVTKRVYEVPYTGQDFDTTKVENTIKLKNNVLEGEYANLKLNVDYELTVSGSMRNVGDPAVEVTIKGIGNYTGQRKVKYEMIPRDLSANCSVDASYNKQEIAYTGRQEEPVVRVKDNGIQTFLNNGIDYTITLDAGVADKINPTRMGDGSKKFISYTIDGKGNYTGQLTMDATNTLLEYRIKGWDFDDDHVVVSGLNSRPTYTGSVIMQNLSLTYKVGQVETILESGQDYQIEYSPASPVGPGPVTIVITGIGKYEGVINRNYMICKQMLTEDKIPADKKDDCEYIEVTYDATEKHIVDPEGNYLNPDGSLQNGVIDFKSGFRVSLITKAGGIKTSEDGLIEGADFEFDFRNCKLPGEQNLIIRGIGKYAGEIKVPVQIYGLLSKARVDIGEVTTFAYNGREQKPKVLGVYYGDNEIAERHYNVEYEEDTTNVGRKTIKIVPDESNGQYYKTENESNNTNKSTKYEVRYDLNRAQVTLDENTFEYNGTEREPHPTVTLQLSGLSAITLEENLDYVVSYENNISAGTGYVKILPKDDNVRSMNSTKAGFKINKFSFADGGVTVTWADDILTGDHVTYTGKAISPTVEVKVAGNDEPLVYGQDYTVSYVNNVNASVGEQRAKVVITGKGNCTGKVEKEFVIDPASLSTNPEFDITAEPAYYNMGTPIPKITVKYLGEKVMNGYTYELDVPSECIANVRTESGSLVSAIMPTTTATLTIRPAEGNNNFEDSYTIYNYEIKPINIATDIGGIDIGQSSMEYRGKAFSASELEIKIACLLAGKTELYNLQRNQDYRVTASTIKDVGTYQIKVEGINGFEGVIDNLEFNVKPRSIENVDFKLVRATGRDEFSYAYTGSEVEPAIASAVDDFESYQLYPTSTDDYEVSYSNNINSAAADGADASKRPSVVIEGKGNYTGKKVINFSIGTSIDLETVEFIGNSTFTYNGTVQKPRTDMVNCQGKTLKLGQDYELIDEGENYIDAGTKTIKIRGIGEYYGVATGTYQIVKSDKTDKIRVVLSGISSNSNTAEYWTTFNGSAVKPTVTVYDDAISKTQALTENDDYTVAYQNNVNAGEATVVVTLNKNYCGSNQKNVNFDIKKRNISKDFELTFSKSTYEYTGNAIKPGFTVKTKSGVSPKATLVSGTDFQVVEYKNNVNAGWASVTIQGTKNYEGTITKKFLIRANLSDPKMTSISVEESFYTGSTMVPIVNIHSGGNTLIQEGDFHIENQWNATNAHSGKVIITPLKEWYYASSKVEKAYEMTYGEGYLQLVGNANRYTYTGKPIKPELKVVDINGNDMTSEVHYDASKVVYYNATKKKANDCTNVGVIKLSVPVYIDGKSTMTIRAQYEIVPKNINDCAITKVNSNTYNGNPIEPAVSIVYNGHKLIKGQEYTEKYSNNVNPGTATVVLKGKGNYTGECKAKFVIEPPAMIGLKAKDISDNSIKLVWSRNAKVTGYEIYSKDGKTFYGKTKELGYTVSGLKAGTTYSFKVRSYVTSKGKTNYGIPKTVTGYTKVYTPNVSVSSKKKGTTTLSWNKKTGIGGYEVYRSTSKKGKYTKVATVPKLLSKYTDKRVESGKTYYYKVRAYKKMKNKYSYGNFSKAKRVVVK